MERVFYPVSAAARYARCRARGGAALLARTFEEACEHAANSAVDGWKPRPRRRILIGAGSNTWRSDLRLDTVYVKTKGPAGRPGKTLGIPWMTRIPGTIGGWVRMNAGAHGHSIGELVKRVKVDGKWWSRRRCGFRYRGSAITGEIEDVEFVADPDRRGWLDEREYLAKRRSFPPGTKGSVFKNPEGDSAGRLLEAAGCLGMKVGGAYVWEEHANVIVSGPGANNSDFLALAYLMRRRVLERFGVALEPEVRGLECLVDDEARQPYPERR